MTTIKSIKEKAKAYDEALERANEMIKAMSNIGGVAKVDDIQHIFPELKESEDERIRKAIRTLILSASRGQTTIVGVTQSDMFAWLEKQGTSYTKRDVDDAYLKGVTDTKNEIEKQYEANYQIRKDIGTFIFNYRGDIKDRAKWMDYLGIKVSFVEKQGEQKETLCDKCKKTQPSHSCQDITALGRCALEKQGEQKLTEFEKAVKQVMEEAIECGDTHNLKADAEMLLSLVHKSAWSEDDELHIRELESLVKQVWTTAEHENDKDTIHKMSDLSFFLKTLKPQPKQEWSEEEQDIIED